MKKYIISIIFLIITSISLLYSKNNKRYFQQYVNYDISVRFTPELYRIEGSEKLLYINHSPDTLNVVYFHLYFNKFRKGALDDGELREETTGSISIFNITNDDSLEKVLDYKIDRTLMKVGLITPLLPNDSIKIKIQFASILPPADDRFGYYGDHFDVGNWYPVPVVYDNKGWHLHQHLENEFYQEWGDFKVKLRMPRGFIVGATGKLLNPLETIADSSWDYYEHQQDTTTVVWKYLAKNVHDFAWTADPDYKLIQSTMDGITINIFVMNHNYNLWQGSEKWIAKALKYMIENYGSYPYDQITIADTYIQAGGIEYPNIVFINSFISPEYQKNFFRVVVVHEMGHQWYYGMLGSNQTEHEWMDEGFTTFAEIETFEAVFGKKNNLIPEPLDWYMKWFPFKYDDRQDNALQYLWLTLSGKEVTPLDFPPDYFGEGLYESQYSKMGDILFMLQYTLGDSLFRKGLHDYYDQWHFKHPYPQDMINVFQKTSGRNLDFFFKQWLKSTRQVDYAVNGFSGKWVDSDSNRVYKSKIKFKRIGKLFMPVDFTVKLKNGDKKYFQIPVDNNSKPGIRTPLEYWHFTQENYDAVIDFQSEIKSVEIDTSLRLMDVNRLNNKSGILPPMRAVFMKPQLNGPPLDSYLWEIWPKVFYNDIDKAMLGIHSYGSYLGVKHNIDTELLFKTVTCDVNFAFNYSNMLDWAGKNSIFNFAIYYMDKHSGGRIGLEKDFKNISANAISISLLTDYVSDISYAATIWDRGRVNWLNLNWDHHYDEYRQNISGWQISWDNGILGSKYDFSRLLLKANYNLQAENSDLKLCMKLKAGYGDGNVPSQFLFSLRGADGWTQFNNQYYRSKGTLPIPWQRNGNLYLDDGAKVRGYSLYGDDIQTSGKQIAVISFDLRIPNPFYVFDVPILGNIIPYFFYDAGNVWNGSAPSITDTKQSFGFSLGWDYFPVLDRIMDINKIQFDFPLWINKPPKGVEKGSFRWLVRFDFDL
jgi:aminopeptidase N